MTYRSGRRESNHPHRHNQRGLSAAEPLEEPPAKTSVELKLELMDRSVKSRFIGGTIVVSKGASHAEDLRDSIKWVELDRGGLNITTYRGRSVSIRLLQKDTELKMVQGAIHIDSWPSELIVLAPKGVEIPNTGRS